MNEQELNELCSLHGFKYSLMGIYYKIVSKRGTYYILNLDHERRKIKLWHANEYAHAGKHYHGEHDNLECIMKSIQSHDEIYLPGHRNNKLTRMTELFNQLHNTSA